MSKDKQELENIHAQIENLTVEFLDYGARLLANCNDITEAIILGKIEINQAPGGDKEKKYLDDKRHLIKPENNHTDDPFYSDCYNEIQQWLKKDISAYGGIISILPKPFYKEVDAQAKKLDDPLKTLKDIKTRLLPPLIEYSSQNSVPEEFNFNETREALVEKLKTLATDKDNPIRIDYPGATFDNVKSDIEPSEESAEDACEDDEESDDWNYEALSETIDREIDTLDQKITLLNKYYTIDNNTDVNLTADKDDEKGQEIIKMAKDVKSNLYSYIARDILLPRNNDKHQNNDEKQTEYVLRNRSESLYSHIEKWSFVYAYRQKQAKYTDFRKKAYDIYSLFNANYAQRIFLGESTCDTIDQLIDAISNNWDSGIELLKANNSARKLIEKEDELLIPAYNTLQSIVQAVVDQEHLSQIDEITHAKERRQNNTDFNSSVYNDYKQWYDACMFKFIYGIDKKYVPLCWKGAKYQPKDYVKKVLFPIINSNSRSAAIREIKRSNLDVLCEYHLISYYCQKKNDDTSDTAHNYDIDAISEIESNILLIDRPTEDSGISLTRLYKNLMKLGEVLNVHYEIKYLDKNTNSRIKDISGASTPIINYINNNQIADALNTVKENVFTHNNFTNSRFLAWVDINSRNGSDRVKRFTEWYYKFKNSRDSYSNYIATIGDVLDYSEFIDKIHDDQMPTNELQYDCLLLYKYMELMNYDNLDNIVEHIKDYYYENSKCPHNSIAIKNEQFSKLIPLNEFRTLTEEESIYKNPDEFNVEEKILLRCLIQKFCLTSSYRSDIPENYEDIAIEYERYRLIFRNLCDVIVPSDNQYAANAFITAYCSELISTSGFDNMIVSSLTNKERPLYESKKNISLTAGVNPSSYNALKKVYNKYRLLASEGEKILVWDNSPIIAIYVNLIKEHLMECKADLSSRKTSLISATVVFILVLSVLIKFFFM